MVFLLLKLNYERLNAMAALTRAPVDYCRLDLWRSASPERSPASSDDVDQS
jgi:hypothetical protein